MVREAAKRVLGLRPFDVQLIGTSMSALSCTLSLTQKASLHEWPLS